MGLQTSQMASEPWLVFLVCCFVLFYGGCDGGDGGGGVVACN